MKDGKYAILFNQFDSSGHLKSQDKMGEFDVSNNVITSVQGMADGMLPKGEITPATELRILYGLNNGYYEVRHEQSFMSRPLQKSNCWHVKIKGLDGYHPVKSIRPPESGQEKNTYILDDNREIPQDYVEDLLMPKVEKSGPYTKLLKAIEPHTKATEVKIDRRFQVPGLAGYSLDGKTIYIDSRLPRGFDNIETDQFLLVHESTEKALMDRLAYSYRHAHDIALHAEKRAVERAGIDWNKYDAFMQHWIKTIGSGVKIPKDKRPPDLDPDRITHDGSIRDIINHTLRKSGDAYHFATIVVKKPHTNKILMGRRNDDDTYILPGGKMEPGESPEEGAKRELFEETGIHTKKLTHKGDETIMAKDGKPMVVHVFEYEGDPETSTEMDPDEEVQDWEWIDTLADLPGIKDNLHIPLSRNVAFKMMGLTKSESLKKADFADKEYQELARKIKERDPSMTPAQITEYIDDSRWRIPGHQIADFIYHPNHTPEHVQKMLDNTLGGFYSKGDKKFILGRIATRGKLDRDTTNRLLDVADKYSSRSSHPEEWASANEIIHKLGSNPHINPDQLDQLANIIEDSGIHRFNQNHNPIINIIKNPNVSEKTIIRHANSSVPKVQAAIAQSPKTPDDIIGRLMTRGVNSYVKKYAKDEARGRGLYEDPEKVKTAFGTNKLREIRDWINAHGGQMNGKDLEKIGYNLGSMGLGHLKSGSGMVSADSIQKQIDSTPKHTYAVSHSIHGFNPEHEDYLDENHPLHTEYANLYGPPNEEGDRELVQEVDPQDEQRHSDEPSKVLQVNLTPQHVQKMKDAGVWNTFKKMNEKSRISNHPAVPHVGLGWVRYTEKPDGIFIDEIQSDLGQSFVKQAANRAKQAVAEGVPPEEAAKDLSQAKKDYPEEHYNKIKEIAFGGKHPSEVLHEVFHQHMRDAGKTGKPIHIWNEQSKAKTALGGTEKGIPAHMQVTYKQNPEKMGYKPAKYGELDTQTKNATDTTKKLFGAETYKTVLRKAVPSLLSLLKKSKYDRVDVGEKPISFGGEDGPVNPNEQIHTNHPWMMDQAGKPLVVKIPHPDVSKKQEQWVTSNMSSLLGKTPASHRQLVMKLYNHLMTGKTRHVRTIMESPEGNPRGEKVPTMRLRHLKSYMHGNSPIQMEFNPGEILITEHEPHGQAILRGKPQWRMTQDKGMEFVGYKKG